jgi:hypothetical protein
MVCCAGAAPGRAHYSMLTSTDDFPAALAVAEALLGSRASRCRSFAAGLYAALFQLHGGDESRRDRLLSGLVARAAAAPSAPPAKVAAV